MIARRMAESRPFIIAHLSDLHCGSPYFVANLLERAIMEINEIEPDVVVCSGDLTTFGYKQEYAQARSYLDRLNCPDVITIPGNHDSRNVGYVHFEEMVGPRSTVLRKEGITFVAVDSSEPDLDHGVVGRSRYAWIEEQFQPEADFRVFVLHHHLLPIPGTGRERNVVHDAGDTLEILQRASVNLVLSGHKHVPVRVAARGPVRRQRRHGLVDAPARQHAALLQRGRDRRRRGRHLPPLPVPRPRDDHPLLALDPGLREAPAAARERLMRPRVLALVDGEHYPPVVRAALEQAASDADVVAALLLGGAEKLDGDPDYGVPLERVVGDAASAMLAAAAAPRRRPGARPVRRAGADRGAPAVAGGERARGRPRLRGRRLRAAAAAAGADLDPRAGGGGHGQAGREDRRGRAHGAAAAATPAAMW